MTTLQFLLPKAGISYPPSFSELASALPTSLDPEWPGFAFGIFVWTWRTLLELRAAGLECVRVETLPRSGIVFAHPDALPPRLTPTPGRTIICFQADRAAPNGVDALLFQSPIGIRHRFKLMLSRLPHAYVPHWTTLGLAPRSEDRGYRIESLAYFGRSHNLDPDLQSDSWAKWCDENGFRWNVVTEPARWHDYRSIDAIIALRPPQKQNRQSKPPSKLLNAYQAGVIPILGNEPSYRAEGKPGRDYITAKTVDDVKHELLSLRDSLKPERMFKNIKAQAARTDIEQLRARWIAAIEKLACAHRGL